MSRARSVSSAAKIRSSVQPWSAMRMERGRYHDLARLRIRDRSTIEGRRRIRPMKSSTFGMLAAGAVAGLLGTVAAVDHASAADAKACYRKHCGKSVAGHDGSCGG